MFPPLVVLLQSNVYVNYLKVSLLADRQAELRSLTRTGGNVNVRLAQQDWRRQKYKKPEHFSEQD